MVQRLLHDPLDAQSVDIPHGEVLDPQGLQDVAGGAAHTVCYLNSTTQHWGCEAQYTSAKHGGQPRECTEPEVTGFQLCLF